jgi:hypothetical protein
MCRMMFIHYTHELPLGVLIIDSILVPARNADDYVDLPDTVNGPDIPDKHTNESVNTLTIRIKFECGSTGARFDAEYTHTQLCALCPLFTMNDELSDTLSEIPTVIPRSDNEIIIRYIVAGKKKTYNVDLKLAPSKYLLNRDEIMKLCAENVTLRKAVDARKVQESAELKAGNERLDQLGEEIFKYDTCIAIAIQKYEKLKSDQAQAASDLSITESKLRIKTDALSSVEAKIRDATFRLYNAENRLEKTLKQLATLEIKVIEATSTLNTVESAHAELTGAVGLCKALFSKTR